MTDLQAEINNAGSYFHLPAGQYALDAPLRLPNRPFTLEGDGIESTELRFNGTDGIVGDYDGFYGPMPVRLSGFTVSTEGAGVGAGVSLRWPDAGSVNEPTAFLDRITVRPAPTLGIPGRSWARGIRLENAWNAKGRDLTVHGDNAQNQYQAAPYLLQAAIELTRGCVDLQLSGLTIYGGMEHGILVKASAVGHGEGLLISQGAIVGARYGVKADSSGMQTPWLALMNCHIYHHAVGVMLQGRTDAAITGNSLCGSSTSNGTVGIYVAGGSDLARITGNSFSDMNGKTNYGIVVDASRAAAISGNTFDSRIGVWLTPSSRECALAGNAYRVSQSHAINQGVGNVLV